jgi:hypothetical protein
MTEETNPANADPIINIALKVSEVNVVLAGVQELPFKIADSLLKSIIAQAQVQLGQQPAEATVTETA